ncbi:MAG: hypothetical protein ACI83O_000032 [Patescibacteria group bacterium]|jgi:hypothetical protein
MEEAYYSLYELLEMIDEPNRSSCKNIYQENKEKFERAKGSKTKHQTWEGGYLGHIKDAMNIALVMYKALNPKRELPFTISDTLLTIYLHDLEKAWKYGGTQKEQEEVQGFPHYQDFIQSKIKEYKFDLSPEHHNAIKYVHGESDDYSPTERIQGPLAAFIHICDNISARIWHDYPKEEKW